MFACVIMIYFLLRASSLSCDMRAAFCFFVPGNGFCLTFCGVWINMRADDRVEVGLLLYVYSGAALCNKKGLF